MNELPIAIPDEFKALGDYEASDFFFNMPHDLWDGLDHSEASAEQKWDALVSDARLMIRAYPQSLGAYTALELASDFMERL